jgi:hypothetical protein
VGVDDEGRHVERAEIERGGGDLAADAVELLQPDERRLDRPFAEECQIEIRVHPTERVLDPASLLVREFNIGNYRLDRGGVRRGKIRPSCVGMDQLLISRPRDLIERACADQGFDQLANRLQSLRNV